MPVSTDFLNFDFNENRPQKEPFFRSSRYVKHGKYIGFVLLISAFINMIGCGAHQNEKSTDGEDSVSLQSRDMALTGDVTTPQAALSMSISFEPTGASSQTRNLLKQGPALNAQYPVVVPEEIPDFIRVWFPQGLEGLDISAAHVVADLNGQEVDLRTEPGRQSGELIVLGIQNLFTSDKSAAVILLKFPSQNMVLKFILRKSVTPLAVQSFSMASDTESPIPLTGAATGTASSLVALRRYEFSNATNTELFLKLNRNPRGGLILQYAKVTPFQESRCATSQRVERWRYRATTKFLMAPSGTYPASEIQNRLNRIAADTSTALEIAVPAHGTAGAILYAVVDSDAQDLVSTRQCRAGASIALVNGCTTRCSWWVPRSALIACGGSVGGGTNEIVKSCLRSAGHASGDFCVTGYSEDQNAVSYLHESLELVGRAVVWDSTAPAGVVFYKDIPAALQRGTLLRQGFEQRLLISGEVDDATPLRLEPLACH